MINKKMFIAATAMSLVIGSAVAAPKTVLKTNKDKLSYTIGYQIGKSFKSQQISIKSTLFQKGFSTALRGKKGLLTEKQMTTVQENFRKAMTAKMLAKQNKLAKTNGSKSDAFMNKIASINGVKKLETGLYYKVIKTGTGDLPTASDTVVVNYEGKLINGKVFDSSYARKQPATFQVGKVIPGWTKALQKMPVGSTWELYISPKLAYGKLAPPSIGPNQALKFKVELISIKKKSS